MGTPSRYGHSTFCSLNHFRRNFNKNNMTIKLDLKSAYSFTKISVFIHKPGDYLSVKFSGGLYISTLNS